MILKLMKKLILILIAVIFMFTACSERMNPTKDQLNYTNYKKLEKPNKITKLNSKVVIKEEDINRIDDFDIISKYLILIDGKGEKLIKIFNLKSQKLLKSFGLPGQGPSEFIGPWQIIPCPKEKNMFWIYDISTRKIKKFNVDKVLENKFDPPEKIISLTVTEGYGFPFWLAIIPDKKILGVGNFYKGRISIYNFSGNFIESIGKIPMILNNDRLANQHSQGFIGQIVYKSNSKEIFIATLYGSIIERYSLDGDLISTFHGPESFFPEYMIVPVGNYHTMIETKKTRHGYVDICYNERLDRMFLLYSGKYIKEDKQASYGNVVYVLSSKGVIIEQYILDKKIIQINMSEDAATLFGLSTGNEIIKFNLKN